MPDVKPYAALFLDRSHNHLDPLPTSNDIDGSEVLVHELASSRVVLVQQRFIIKFGIHVSPVEGHSMLYVATSTTIPVPTLYAMYQCREGGAGDVAGGPPRDDMFEDMHDGMETSLTTEDELVQCVIRAYSACTGERMAHKTRYYQRVLPTILRGNGPLVFAHNDFQRRNIIVQPDGTPVIIDWEFASWYPNYWEYSTATFANGGWER